MLTYSCQKKKSLIIVWDTEGGLLQAGLVAQDSRGGAAASSEASSKASSKVSRKASRFRV